MAKNPGSDPVISRRNRALVLVSCGTVACALAGITARTAGLTFLNEAFSALAGTGAGILIVLFIARIDGKRRP